MILTLSDFITAFSVLSTFSASCCLAWKFKSSVLNSESFLRKIKSILIYRIKDSYFNLSWSSEEHEKSYPDRFRSVIWLLRICLISWNLVVLMSELSSRLSDCSGWSGDWGSEFESIWVLAESTWRDGCSWVFKLRRKLF